MQLVLRLDDHVQPLAGRMKLDVAAAKLTSAIGRDGLPVQELAVGVAEYLEGAAVLFPHAGYSLVAASRQNDGTAGGHYADVMGIHSSIERCLLADVGSDRAVGAQAIHGDATRFIEGGQQIFAPGVDGDVDRPMTQPDRVANRLERSQ